MSQVYAAYRRPEDLGTPASESGTTVQLTVDGKTVTVPEGTTVIRAVALAGINIPRLCASDMLEPFGSCRLRSRNSCARERRSFRPWPNRH